jgi:hypothetical protein
MVRSLVRTINGLGAHGGYSQGVYIIRWDFNEVSCGPQKISMGGSRNGNGRLRDK